MSGYRDPHWDSGIKDIRVGIATCPDIVIRTGKEYLLFFSTDRLHPRCRSCIIGLSGFQPDSLLRTSAWFVIGTNDGNTAMAPSKSKSGIVVDC